MGEAERGAIEEQQIGNIASSQGDCLSRERTRMVLRPDARVALMGIPLVQAKGEVLNRC
jgi:hypothetical protein